jgi:hypothetical protein
MKSTLNTWLGSSWYTIQGGSDYYEGRLVGDIISGYPVAVLVYERADSHSPHLTGHPTDRVIGHWIAVHGYDADGAWSFYADSVHGTGFWPQVPAHDWITSADLMELMAPRGYIW